MEWGHASQQTKPQLLHNTITIHMHGWCTRNAHPLPDVQNLASNPPWQKPGCAVPPLREKRQKPPWSPNFDPQVRTTPPLMLEKIGPLEKILARKARQIFFEVSFFKIWPDFFVKFINWKIFSGKIVSIYYRFPQICQLDYNKQQVFNAILTPFEFFWESGEDRWCTHPPWKVTQVHTSTTWESARKKKSYPLCRPGPCTCMAKNVAKHRQSWVTKFSASPRS